MCPSVFYSVPTAIRALRLFTQREAIEAHPKLKGDKDLIHDADPLTEQGRKAFRSVLR